MRFMSVLFTVLSLSSPALAELKYTTSPDAVCNDGNQATFSHFPATSNKWLVYVQGGGVAINADSFRQRNIHMKTAMSLDHFGDWYPMVRDFSENGYNVIVIPHCSSDMHQGFHSHEIDGKTVKFHGRKIFEDIFSQYDTTFASADSLVIAGYSAGSIGIGFNADLIARYEHAFVVADSFWLDTESLKARLGWTKGPWVEITKFIYPNMPAHCQGDHWAHCFPSRSHFEKMGIRNVFPIWNIGDSYNRHGDQAVVRASTHDDIKFYGAGFSIDAKKRNAVGFEGNNFGHVMTGNKLYSRTFDGVTVRDMIWNWIEGRTPAMHILD